MFGLVIVEAAVISLTGAALGLGAAVILPIVGGASFLGCQAYEWTHLIREGQHLMNHAKGAPFLVNPWGPPQYGQSFFLLTGFHGAHVLSGLIILTVTVLGMIVGLVNLQNALLGEFADLSLAFQSLNQSYGTPSYRGCWKSWGRTSWVAGSSFIDVFNGCVGGGGGSVGCYGSDIVGGTGYHLPSNSGPVIVGPQMTNDPSAPSSRGVDACPPGLVSPTAPATGQPVPNASSVPCQNCQ